MVADCRFVCFSKKKFLVDGCCYILNTYGCDSKGPKVNFKESAI
jgi:hypothetical protein